MRQGLAAFLLLPAFLCLQSCDGQASSATAPFSVPDTYIGTWEHYELRYDSETYRSYVVGESMQILADGSGTLAYAATDSTAKRTCSLRLSGAEPTYRVTLTDGSLRQAGTLDSVGAELVLTIGGKAGIHFTRLVQLKAPIPG